MSRAEEATLASPPRGRPRAARVRRLAGAIFALVLVEIAAGATFEVLDPKGSSGDIGFAATFLLFPIVGLLLARRRPDNALGWLMLAIGAIAVEPGDAYGSYALHAGLPGGAWAMGAFTWSWIPTVSLAGTFLLLLFPDGHLPSPRWRWLAWTIAIGMIVSSLGILLGSTTLADSGFPHVSNPWGNDAIRSFAPIVIAAIVTVPVGILGSALSLVLRYRRSGPVERLQIRWLASAAAVLAVVYAITMVASASSAAGWGSGGGWLGVLQAVSIFLFALIPISIGVAVLRYRLYDIDVVIRKTVVYGLLVVFVTIVYVALVVGIGTWIGRESSFLTMLAAVLVAVSFQPVRQVLTHLADRLVYRRRATPYEALSTFSSRLGDAYATSDLLPRMARILGEATGARRADVWLKIGDELRPTASWPSEIERPRPQPAANGELPALPDADAAFPVRHRGELLGALALAKPPSDPMSPTDEKLASDLAGQAGLVLSNARLTTDLEARIEDLRALQKRLVTAQDQERRRLERNIHDGAQQQLVALSVKLRLAQQLVSNDPAKAEGMLGELQTQTTETLEDLRDLARGIYPPLLADQGLVAALEAQISKSMLPVSLEPDGVERYPQEVEAAAYFCVLEALQNVAKYANASRVEVHLGGRDGSLRFEVTDDGVGFDTASTSYGTGLRGMADRLAALDCTLEVRSSVGVGTSVSGRIPVEVLT